MKKVFANLKEVFPNNTKILRRKYVNRFIKITYGHGINDIVKRFQVERPTDIAYSFSGRVYYQFFTEKYCQPPCKTAENRIFWGSLFIGFQSACLRSQSIFDIHR